MLLLMFAGWVNRHQLEVIEYLQEENRVLKERLGGGRIHFTDADAGFLGGKRYLILDRDAKYSDAFCTLLVREGIHVIRLRPRSPNLNSYAERFVRSIKEECLSRMIFFGRASLRRAITQYLGHYHRERNHQGLGNRLLQPVAAIGELHEPVIRCQRLGGMLSYYHRAAA